VNNAEFVAILKCNIYQNLGSVITGFALWITKVKILLNKFSIIWKSITGILNRYLVCVKYFLGADHKKLSNALL
jgi:hypothetical protein